MNIKTLFKILKRFLVVLFIFFIVFCLLMATPRLISFINPENPPIGYHFEALDLLAVGLGLESVVNRTPEVPSSIEVIKDIGYKNVNGKSLQLDIYIPRDIVKPAPLLVFIHGGGWKGGKRQDYLVYLVDFARKGYITATVSYRFGRDSLYPACVGDITDAVQWFNKHAHVYGYDSDRIALIGGSAGGHLSMLAAYGWKNPHPETDSAKHRIKAVVDIYGPVDFTTEYARTNPLVTNFIGHSFKEAPQLYKEASPLQYLDKDDPPTLILHGTSDMLLPISQSDTLKAHLEELGVPVVYYRLPLWPHAMDIDKRVNDFCQLKMNEFFDRYLK